MIPPLESAALSRLQSLINGALDLDPGSKQSLRDMAGKVLAIQSTFPPKSLCIAVCADGHLRLPRDDTGEPADLTLTGTPVALAALFVQASRRTSLADTGVTIDGDQELLHQLSAILRELDLDWEQALAGVIGDAAAHIAASGVRRALNWHSEAAARSASGLGEYFREESGYTVGNAEAEQWFTQVRQLSRDTDRLAARAAKLGKSLASHSD